MSEEIGFEVVLNTPYEQAMSSIVDALKLEGFGVLTRIDVHETLKEKLGVEFRPYTILGACNPHLAHRALSQDAVVGLMLPCNVTVEFDTQQTTLVRIANPEVMLQVGSLRNNDALAEVAKEARTRLERAAQSVLERSE